MEWQVSLISWMFSLLAKFVLLSEELLHFLHCWISLYVKMCYIVILCICGAVWKEAAMCHFHMVFLCVQNGTKNISLEKKFCTYFKIFKFFNSFFMWLLSQWHLLKCHLLYPRFLMCTTILGNTYNMFIKPVKPKFYLQKLRLWIYIYIYMYVSYVPCML